MLVISLIAIAQYSQNNFDLYEETTASIGNEIFIDELPFEISDEEDSPMDFDTKDYLPVGFNPNGEATFIEYFEISMEEDDSPFDFNTKLYLPENFNPYLMDQISDYYEVTSEEEDAHFDFDVNMYLPEGFDPYQGLPNRIQLAAL